ncbi:hypothetical protein EYF80_013265 [Liparis tanakae]|uniref:Uncharacterized protein n=1 Tax=Liparis tanakae TaxID=230148 RepID=A0A4Z2IET7_9TELE|nr:hypothetical protein EYF80_013265 [Liparis tanakae]
MWSTGAGLMVRREEVWDAARSCSLEYGGTLGGRPCSFMVDSPPVDSPFREPQSRSALALALSFSFSRSVMFTGPALARLDILQPPGSLIRGGPADDVGTGFRVNRPGSMGRAAERPITLNVLDLAGRGRLRYWMLLRAIGPRKLCSLLASKLFFRPPEGAAPPAGFMGMPEDLGSLPTVAEPLEMVAPPAVITVAVPVAVGGLL